MANILYDIGLDEWRDWEDETFKVLLIQDSYTVDRNHEFVDDVSSEELSVSGYARITITSPTRTLSHSLHRYIYDCDDLDFGALAGTQTIAGAIVYKEITNDADSILMAFIELSPFVTDGSSFVATVPTAGIAFARQSTV